MKSFFRFAAAIALMGMATLASAKKGPAAGAPDETARLRALSVTIDALKSDDLSMRSVALQTLAKAKPAGALPHVLLTLRSDDADVRSYAAVVLGALGDATAVPYLMAAARTARFNWELADELRALGKLGKGDASVIALLQGWVDDDGASDVVRSAAFEALGRLAAPEKLQDLLDSVATDRDRRALGTALLDRADARGVQLMIDALASTDDDVSAAAMEDLAARDPKLASKLLSGMLKDNEAPEAARDRAAAILGAYGAAYVGGVIPGLSATSRTVRTGSAAALAHSPLPKAKAPLKKLLGDKEQITAVMSGLALSVMGDKSVVAPLNKLMGTENHLNGPATNWVVLSLALVGDKPATEKVDAMIRDQSIPYASMQLPRAAKLLLPYLTRSLSPDSTLGSSRQGADWLLGTLARAPDHADVLGAIGAALKVPGQKMSALMAIVKMADPAASALAVPLLDDPDKNVQMAAGLAIIAGVSGPKPKTVFWY